MYLNKTVTIQWNYSAEAKAQRKEARILRYFYKAQQGKGMSKSWIERSTCADAQANLYIENCMLFGLLVMVGWFVVAHKVNISEVQQQWKFLSGSRDSIGQFSVGRHVRNLDLHCHPVDSLSLDVIDLVCFGLLSCTLWNY